MNVYIKDNFIKLQQALKLAGFVDQGSDAKMLIQDGNVKVKCSGGIRELAVVKEMYDMGVARFGMGVKSAENIIRLLKEEE